MSEKTNPSFGVNLEKNVWACQSASCVKARKGRKGGNVLDFVAAMESCTIRDAALKLAEWFSVQSVRSEASTPQKDAGDELVAEGTSAAPEGSDEEGNKPLSFTLKGIEPSHPYFKHRGILPPTAEHFGAGFFAGRGSMSRRVVLPIHNDAGELVAYAGRSIDTTEPKYKLPPGFKKSQVIYNLHRVLALGPDPSGAKRIVLVEGFFDAMKVHQCGHPHVAALMGSSMSERQEELVCSRFNQVVLLMDGDEAGKGAAEEIAARLVKHLFVHVASVPDGRQPDQLSSEQLRAILGSF